MKSANPLHPTSHSKPVGKYSPGIEWATSSADRWIFISGQVSTDAQGHLLGPGDAGRQAEVVFERLAQVLAEAGATLTNLVNLVIYLVDRRDFKAVSSVRDRLLSTPAPASTLVIVSELVEEGCLVEISATALVRHPLPKG